jgi:hypothetical protein
LVNNDYKYKVSNRDVIWFNGIWMNETTNWRILLRNMGIKLTKMSGRNLGQQIEKKRPLVYNYRLTMVYGRYIYIYTVYILNRVYQPT